MAEIGFYHLTRTTAEAALPPLLGKTLAAGQRAVVRCGTAERLAMVDRALWLCITPDWLPHGTSHGALQPIYLTLDDECPNGGRFLFLLDGTTTTLIDRYERVFDLFDGTDEIAVAAARERWTERKQAGHVLTYWQQGAKGWSQGGAG